jgi:hypothetical protein
VGRRAHLHLHVDVRPSRHQCLHGRRVSVLGRQEQRSRPILHPTHTSITSSASSQGSRVTLEDRRRPVAAQPAPTVDTMRREVGAGWGNVDTSFWTFTSAPAASSTFTIAVWPYPAAMRSGVCNPHPIVREQSAQPRENRRRRDSPRQSSPPRVTRWEEVLMRLGRTCPPFSAR